MKVYCRFAPPHAPVIAEGGRDEHDTHISWPRSSMVHLSLRGGASGVGNRQRQTFVVTDPGTGGVASFSCCRAFFPQCLPVNVVDTSPLSAASSSTPGAQQHPRQQQEEVFNEVARPFLVDLISGKRCTFLAYGQTATGKTYTMFGPNADGGDAAPLRPRQSAPDPRCGEASSVAAGKEEEEGSGEEGEEGIVPRFYRAIFNILRPGGEHRRAVSFVDVSCLEVYNESATDLMALLLQDQQQQQQRSGRATTSKKSSGKSTVERDGVAADAAWKMWLRYERDRCADARDAFDMSAPKSAVNAPFTRDMAPGKVVYKATEKTTVMRSVLRLRCESAEECCSLLRGVLALRCRSQTERNVRSSRSHLVLRIVLYGVAGSATQLGEALFVDLAGSETYRDHVWTSSSTFAEQGGPNGREGLLGSSSQQFGLNDPPLVSSTFTSTRCDSNGLTAAQRNALRMNEMRRINSSLLALRKVVRALRSVSPSAPRVPFRDSTLTTILEPFLVSGGESTVVWVVCCSCRQCDFFETIESLRLGAEVSAIPASVQLHPPVRSARLTNKGDDSVKATATAGDATNMPSARNELSMSALSSLLFSTDFDAQRRGECRRGGAASGPIIQPGGGRTISAEATKDLLFACSNDTNANNKNDKVKTTQAELEKYRQYAQQLLEHCNKLSDRYDECVKNLVETKEALALRDRDVAHLREALAATRNPQKLSDAMLGDNIKPAFSAWPPKGGAHAERNDPSTRSGCFSFKQEGSQPIVTRETAGTEDKAEEKDREADWFVETILKRYCVQSDSPNQMRGTIDKKKHATGRFVGMPLGMLATNDGGGTSLSLSTSSNACTGAVSAGDCAMTTPLQEKENLTTVVKGKARRVQIVSFVSPSSHGAVPPMRTKLELDPYRIHLPPPPQRSSLCRRTTLSQEEAPLQHGTVKASEQSIHSGGVRVPS